MECAVGCPVSNRMMCMEKILKGCQSKVWSNQLTLKISPPIIDTITTLLLNDHIMYNHISGYDLPHLSMLEFLLAAHTITHTIWWICEEDKGRR
jgi:hypothetical protein